MIRPRFVVLTLMVFGAAAMRLLPHPPNFTPMIPLALFGGAYYSSRRAAFLVPLMAMAISDLGLTIMNGYAFVSPMRLIVYGLFAFMTLWGLSMKNRVTWKGAIGSTVGGSVLFFVVTNFAVWFGGDGIVYPMNFDGIVACYIAAIPFFRNMLAGSLLYGGVLFGGFELARRRFRSLDPLPETGMAR